MNPKELKEHIQQELSNKDIFPPEIPVKEEIGKLGLMWPRTYAEIHDATPLLNSYAESGCPADCGPDWSLEKIVTLMKRGPHRSSKKKDAVRQLRKETEEKITNKYARIVRWGDIKHDIPKKLKISPVAMIPHKSKKYRCILDLSFTLFQDGKSYTSVNTTTNKQAKPQAMAQLGLSLKRIVALMADNYNEDKPFMFVKLDIKDGFWRMAVSNEDAWNFAYVLPSLKPLQSDDEIELVIPNSLQMGWCESPPFFCSGSETARDIIESIAYNPNLPPHRLEHDMLKDVMDNTSFLPISNGKTSFEVFVDDFIGTTNNIATEHLQQVSRAMLHGIHSIFPPPSITGHSGEDPISEQKIHKGEGIWAFEKEVLGWIFNGQKFTIRLPSKKCQEIITFIRKILKIKRPSLNKYQKLAGKLQHASFGIPGGTGLFTPIQMAMSGNPSFIPLTSELKCILKDWQYMIKYMDTNPTSVLQLVQNYPDYIGYSDSCGMGTGGTWSSGTKHLSPFLWQLRWPSDIERSLVTSSNPSGTITMNDLELAGMVLNWYALECNVHCLKHHHIANFCDNTSAVAWAYRLRTSKSRIAGRLLRLLSIRIHSRQASNLLPMNIAGEENIMADVVSRAFKDGKYFSASSNLTDHFNSHFPLPQNYSWREFHMPKEIISHVISCLRGDILPMAWLLEPPRIGRNIGPTGANIARSSDASPSSATSLPSPETSWSGPLLHGSGLALTEGEIRSKFRASRTRSRPSARPSCWLANQAQSTGRTRSTT
jgi:hypothetical protein